jgi:hypothetical protein
VVPARLRQHYVPPELETRPPRHAVTDRVAETTRSTRRGPNRETRRAPCVRRAFQQSALRFGLRWRRPAYNLSFFFSFFSRNNIFLSQQINQQYLSAQPNGAYGSDARKDELKASAHGHEHGQGCRATTSACHEYVLRASDAFASLPVSMRFRRV